MESSSAARTLDHLLAASLTNPPAEQWFHSALLSTRVLVHPSIYLQQHSESSPPAGGQLVDMQKRKECKTVQLGLQNLAESLTSAARVPP